MWNMCCLWVSPQSISSTWTVFIPAERSWKYSCVVRWISRLYSLQCFPWIPRVPFLRLLAHAFYLCQENTKLNVFWPSRSTLCPWRAHCHFEISQSNTAQERWKEKCFRSHFCWFFFVYYVVNQKKRASYPPGLCFLNLWLVTFATSASSLTVGRLAPQLPTEMVDIIILVWCTYFLLSGPHTERYRYTLYVLCLHGLSGEDSEWTFSPVRLICLLGQWDVIASSSHVK